MIMVVIMMMIIAVSAKITTIASFGAPCKAPQKNNQDDNNDNNDKNDNNDSDSNYYDNAYRCLRK